MLEFGADTAHRGKREDPVLATRATPPLDSTKPGNPGMRWSTAADALDVPLNQLYAALRRTAPRLACT